MVIHQIWGNVMILETTRNQKAKEVIQTIKERIRQRERIGVPNEKMRALKVVIRSK